MVGAKKVMRKRLLTKFDFAKTKAAANKLKMYRTPCNFQQEVKKVIDGTQETKLVIEAPFNRITGGTLENWTTFTSGITTTSEVYALISPVSMGTDDHQRIGDSIEPKSLKVKYNVCIQPSDLYSGNVIADLWFLTSKSIKDERDTLQIPTGRLMNSGDGLNVPYDGTSYTAMLPVNKSEFNVIAHRRIRLNKGSGDPNSLCTGSITSGIATNLYYTSQGSVNIPLPKKLLFEERSRTTPINAFPFLMIGFHSVDTTGGGAPISMRIFAQAQSHLYYKDA